MNRLLIIAALILPWQNTARAADPAPPARDVRPVILAMREEISARPSRVLIAVEDALAMNEQAACEIVKEAITSTKADPRLVGEIVFTALQHAPAMTTAIVECAIRTAPEATAEIEQAMRRALGKSAGRTEAGKKTENEPPVAPLGEKETSGKEPSGKGVAVPAPAVPAAAEEFWDSFLPGSVGVGGIYLITPGHASGPCFPGGPCCSGELSPSCLKP